MGPSQGLMSPFPDQACGPREFTCAKGSSRLDGWVSRVFNQARTHSKRGLSFFALPRTELEPEMGPFKDAVP